MQKLYGKVINQFTALLTSVSNFILFKIKNYKNGIMIFSMLKTLTVFSSESNQGYRYSMKNV